MYNHAVRAFLNNGRFVDIYFNQDSGKVYYRWKIDTVTGIKHAGVYIGQDVAGNGYFVHNHYQLGTPRLVFYNDFTLGKELHLYHERCVNPWNVTVSKALGHVVRQEPFKLLSYNCQTLVNSACNNQRKSEDAGRILGGVALTAGVALLLGALFSNNE
jgi:hypothetical protein